MLRVLLSSSALAAAALAAQPALAQDAGPYFDGPYVSGAVSLDFAGEQLPPASFDTDRNGVYGDDVRTTGGVFAFSNGFCRGAATGASPAAKCNADDDDIGYAVRLGYDRRFGGGPLVGGVLIEGSSSNAVDYTTGYSTTPASYTTPRELDYSIAARTRPASRRVAGAACSTCTGGVSYAKHQPRFRHHQHRQLVRHHRRQQDAVWGVAGRRRSRSHAGAEHRRRAGIPLQSAYEDDKSYVAGRARALPGNQPVPAGFRAATSLRPDRITDFDYHSFRASGRLPLLRTWPQGKKKGRPRGHPFSLRISGRRATGRELFSRPCGSPSCARSGRGAPCAGGSTWASLRPSRRRRYRRSPVPAS